MNSINTCRICNNSESNKEFKLKEFMFGTNEEFNYFQCGKCGCLQISEIPEDLSKYYKNAYYSYSKVDEVFYQTVEGLKKLKKITRSINSTQLNTHDNYSFFGVLGITKKDKVLDIGCGSGFFFYPLKNLGYNVTGADPFNQEKISYKNGFIVNNLYINQITDKYDFIFLNHSFEHIPDQAQTMIDLKKILTTNGKIVIRIPLSDSYCFEHYKESWWQLDPPRHLYLHSKKSMQELCNKQGLKLNKIIYDSTRAQFLHSEMIQEGYSLLEQAKIKKNKIKLSFLKKFYKYKAAKLNKSLSGDQAAFIISTQN
jgi:SAM-dependent methyltransferase